MEHKPNRRCGNRPCNKSKLEGIMKRTVLRIANSTVEKPARREETVLRSVIETTMEITSLIVFVGMVGVWALAFGVAG